MSRSARNRAAAKARGSAPRGVVTSNRPAVIPSADHLSIRHGGYPGRKSSVNYAGAGDEGYRSAWNHSPYYRTAVTIDSRWSA